MDNNNLKTKLQFFYLIQQLQNIRNTTNKQEIINNLKKYDINDIKNMRKVAEELKEKLDEINKRNN